MRDYGRVHSAFWTSQDIRRLSDDGRILALYLLTSPHTTITGAFRLPDGYVSEDLQWASGRVAKGFAELLANGFVNRCETTKWVWIRKFLDWNTPENPNQWKAARKLATQIPEQCCWRSEFQRLFARIAGDPEPPEEPLPNPSQTVPVTVSKSGTGTEIGTEAGIRVPSEPVALKRDEGAIGKVFEHWKLTHHHPRAQLDDKRQKLIRRALTKYSEADLCLAISGYRHSAYHMGQNENGTVYDSLELFLRDSEHVDRGLKLYADPPRIDLSPQTRRIISQTEGWVPPEVRHAAN